MTIDTLNAAAALERAAAELKSIDLRTLPKGGARDAVKEARGWTNDALTAIKTATVKAARA